MSTLPESSQVNMTEAESCLWNALSSADFGSDAFYPQYKVGGGYVVDFCLPQRKLIVEVENPETMEYDEYYVIRNASLKADGWRLLRFTDHDAIKNTEGVISVILAALGRPSSSALRSTVKPIGGMIDFEI